VEDRQLKRVSVLIPAHNEEDNIFDTVIAAFALPGVTRVVVVDDASTDRTSEMAEKAGAMVKLLNINAGKGAAMNAGAPLLDGDIVLLLDGDLGASAIGAAPLLEPVISEEADMTVAVFPRSGKKGGFGLVKGLARGGIRYYTGLEMTAPLSGQRGMSRKAFESVLPFAEGYGVEVALTVKAAAGGFRVREIPVDMTHKETGRDLKGFMHRGRQFNDVLRTLLSIRKYICRAANRGVH
jgi:glycosyltransferase involved in cell wall biosynthesis